MIHLYILKTVAFGKRDWVIECAYSQVQTLNNLPGSKIDPLNMHLFLESVTLNLIGMKQSIRTIQ